MTRFLLLVTAVASVEGTSKNDAFGMKPGGVRSLRAPAGLDAHVAENFLPASGPIALSAPKSR